MAKSDKRNEDIGVEVKEKENKKKKPQSIKKIRLVTPDAVNINLCYEKEFITKYKKKIVKLVNENINLKKGDIYELESEVIKAINSGKYGKIVLEEVKES